jgi:thiamine-monophosphate kinase
MPFEASFIDALRGLATAPGARGLRDDAATLGPYVLTHDMLVEGVHFLGTDPPESVAWKLLAVNLSDLAAKGSRPVAALMGVSLSGDEDWYQRFIAGLGEALAAHRVALLGGDTVSSTERVLGLTLIGEAGDSTPSRAGARDGDALFVTGCIGDAGLGLEIARAEPESGDPLVEAYRRPQPQLEAGVILAPAVTAMMDVSDGLLIDAARMADASGCAAMIDLDSVPLSSAFLSRAGQDRAARIKAATAGDDYQLLFTASRPLPALPCPVTRIGKMVPGTGVHLYDRDGAVPLPARLGWLHGLP